MKKRQKKQALTLGLTLGLLFIPFITQAGAFTDALGWFGLYFGGFSLLNIIGSIIAGLFVIIGGLALVFLIVGGFRYVTSYGNTDQAEAAKKTVLYAIIGLAIAISAYTIVKTVPQALFGG